jgi:outer membrane immunogenic protein
MLRKLLLGSALSLAFVVPALAQPATTWAWSGPYGGLNVGYGWGNDNFNAAGSFDAAGTAPAYGYFNHRADGVTGGAQLGYNYQLGNGLVVGGETDFDVTNQHFNGPYGGYDGSGNAYTGDIASRLDYLGTVRARLGAPVMGGRLMPYITGGLAYGRVKTADAFACPSCAAGEGGSAYGSSDSVGWTAGAGLEYALTHHLSMKVEYLYARLGDQNLNTPNGGFGGPGGAIYNASADQRFDSNIVRVGFNYHF